MTGIEQERSSFDPMRRRLLLAGGVFALTWPVKKIAETVYELSVPFTRTERPLLKDTIKPESILLGIAPDKNNVDCDPRIASDFHIINLMADWYSNWCVEEAGKVAKFGKIPMISIDPRSLSGKDPFPFASFGEKHGDHIKKRLERFKSGGPVLLRFAYEMNGGWFPYGSQVNKPEDFREAWKYFAKTTKEILPEAKLVFSPNTLYPLAPYLPPPDEYDIIGLDGYNKYRKENPLVKFLFGHIFPSHFQPDYSFEQVFGPDILTLQRLAPDKPILITEAGIAESKEEGSRWWEEALTRFPKYRNVIGLCIFAWDKGSLKTISDYLMGEADWNVLGKRRGEWNIIQKIVKTDPAYMNSVRVKPTEIAGVLAGNKL